MRDSIRRFFETTTISIIYISILILAYTLVVIPRSNEEHKLPGETSDVSYNSEIDKNIEELFKKKNKAVLKNDTKFLESIYDMENNLGIWAYENEIRKIKYIEDWGNKQGVEFTQINPTVVIKNIKKNEDKYSVNLLCSTEYKYKYVDDKDINISRVGTHHILDLIEKDEKLEIIKEWYDDPFAATVDLDIFNDKKITNHINNNKRKDKQVKELSKARKIAISYAHKYAGAASEEKYGFKYNNNYKDYSGEGGDCTNFISQVLLEGGFKKDGTWNYNSGEGSKAWVNAGGFKEYLIYSGRGSLIASGYYEEVYRNAYDLTAGDIVSYEKEGKVSHTAVVTDFDSKGYPLITCHNTDRNNVPFDIGFTDGLTRFHLIKMNY